MNESNDMTRGWELLGDMFRTGLHTETTGPRRSFQLAKHPFFSLLFFLFSTALTSHVWMRHSRARGKKDEEVFITIYSSMRLCRLWQLRIRICHLRRMPMSMPYPFGLKLSSAITFKEIFECSWILKSSDPNTSQFVFSISVVHQKQKQKICD